MTDLVICDNTLKIQVQKSASHLSHLSHLPRHRPSILSRRRHRNQGRTDLKGGACSGCGGGEGRHKGHWIIKDVDNIFWGENTMRFR